MALLETDWVHLQETIRCCIEDLSGLCTFWRDENIPQVNPREPAVMLLNINSLFTRGLPAATYVGAGEPGSSVVVPKVQNLVEMVLEVSCQAGEHVPGKLAIQYMNRLMRKIQLPGVQQKLQEVCIGVADTGTVTSLNFDSGDGWLLSQATAEWRVYLNDTWMDTGLQLETIEQVCGEMPEDVIVDIPPPGTV